MTKEDFSTILNDVKINILQEYETSALSRLSEIEFEEKFALELILVLNGRLNVEYKKGSTIFPDIGCAPYGVEIKTTQADKWVCLGNSIMEGTRRDGIEHIFIAFLKKGGTTDIRIKEYDTCISDIKVTHSPRYEVNMDIDHDQTIFSQLDITYSEFKDDSNKIQRLRQYYKNNGVESWWLDEETGETTTPMKLESFGDLEADVKKKFLVELFALFPEMLNKQYSAASTYLISRYGVYDKSFRDKISAGGKKEITINGKVETISQSVANVINLLPSIINFIEDNKNLLTKQWKETPIDFVASWFEKCDLYLQQANDVVGPSISLEQVHKNNITL